MLSNYKLVSRFICVIILTLGLGGCVLTPEELAQLDAYSQVPVSVKHYKRSEVDRVLPAHQVITQRQYIKKQSHISSTPRSVKKTKKPTKKIVANNDEQDSCLGTVSLDRVGTTKIKRKFS